MPTSVMSSSLHSYPRRRSALSIFWNTEIGRLPRPFSQNARLNGSRSGTPALPKPTSAAPSDEAQRLTVEPADIAKTHLGVAIEGGRPANLTAVEGRVPDDGASMLIPAGDV